MPGRTAEALVRRGKLQEILPLPPLPERLQREASGSVLLTEAWLFWTELFSAR